MIFYWIDTFSLGYLKTATEVGVYNAAVPIALLLFVIPEIFMQLFFPLISKEYGRNNKVLIEQLSKQVTKWILIANLPIFILLFLFPGAALNLLFGSQFLGAEMSLRILILSAILTTTFIVSQQLLSMTGKSKIILINMVIAAVINLVLNQFLIPIKTLGVIDNATGVNGAAVATLISNIIFLTLIFIQSYRYTSIFPFRKKLFNVFISLGVALIPLLLLRNFMQINILSMGLMCLTFVLVYLVSLFLTKSLDAHDTEILNKIRTKIAAVRFNQPRTFS
jgi:O-antigen/teichoic acid export membrane protein